MIGKQKNTRLHPPQKYDLDEHSQFDELYGIKSWSSNTYKQHTNVYGQSYNHGHVDS